MRTVLALIFTVSSATALAQTIPYSMESPLPPEQSKSLGQRFYREIQLQITKPYDLDKHSLPQAQRIGLYLQQQPVQVHWNWQSGWRAYTLRIPYQVISQSAKKAFAFVPPFVFELSDGQQNYPVVLEPFSVNIDAGPSLADRAAGTALPLAAAQPPPAQQTMHVLIATMTSTALLLLLCLMYLWRTLLGPAWQRYNLPFSRAHRAIRRLPADAEATRRFIIAHRAFNACAGHTVLSCDLPHFLATQPQFHAHAAAMAEFFQRSDLQLYTRNPPADSRQHITALLKHCSKAEATG